VDNFLEILVESDQIGIWGINILSEGDPETQMLWAIAADMILDIAVVVYPSEESLPVARNLFVIHTINMFDWIQTPSPKSATILDQLGEVDGHSARAWQALYVEHFWRSCCQRPSNGCWPSRSAES
jgi:hypothetical protein